MFMRTSEQRGDHSARLLIDFSDFRSRKRHFSKAMDIVELCEHCSPAPAGKHATQVPFGVHARINHPGGPILQKFSSQTP